MELELTIIGKLYSKSYNRKLYYFGGRPRLIKSAEAQNYETSARSQLIPQLKGHETFLEPVSLEVHVYYENKRPDLDITLLMDVLEHAGVYRNDRQVYEIHAYKHFDKDNPRVFVRIKKAA